MLVQSMGLEIPASEWKRLSHKDRRKLINREKKRIKRIELAKQRLLEQQEFEEYLKSTEGIEKQKLAEQKRHQEEIERQLRHEEWVEKERRIQEEFQHKREKEETKLKEREEREKMIREEWEELEKREKEAAEKRNKGKTSKETMLEEALAGIDATLESMDNDEHMPWHNPFAPAEEQQSKRPTKTTATSSSSSRYPVAPPISLEKENPVKNYGTEKDKINCPFFIKTGACRYGDTCSRTHPKPSTSTTLIIQNMYNHAALTQQFPDDQDAALEVDDSELMADYTDFYNDVYPALAECGKVVQFKVSRNYELHLKGNVYVQFSTEEECAAAVKVFDGRWYAGKKLSCVYCPVQKWKTAICGLYNRQQCPKGRHCNFLHVFENPGGAFSLGTDDDNDDYPDRRGSSSHHRRRFTRDNSRMSPDNSPSSHHRRGDGDRRGYRDGRQYTSPVGRRRSRSPLDRRREMSPYYRRRDESPPYSRKRRRSRSHSNDRHRSYSRSISPDIKERRQSRYSREERSEANSSEEGGSYRVQRKRSLSREQDEKKHKKKKKRKSKHSKKHKQRCRRSSSGSGYDSEGVESREKDMKKMMDEVLRHVT